ncbi:cupredoxin domain-containing protein [Marinicella litoralis]|uniref:Plastocyanin n=1 Tax=Marinicella litoralis TaxID=644220 RepID=A0A4V3DI43_9GAMM|nr:hypothetical protein [Marinicella litoralis]TDR20671.1 plastocyanin [Marinicella litoralis]
MKYVSFMFYLLLSHVTLAANHQVIVHENRFSPEVVNVQSGDTVQWVVTAGNHQISANANNQAVAFTSPMLTPNSQFSFIVEGSGGEIYYQSTADPNMQGAIVVAAEANDFVIDERINANYFNPDTPGQGMLFEYVPSSQLLIAYWFTYNQAGDSQQWFIATGNPMGNRATLTVAEPMGGKLNDPQTIHVATWGELTLVFDNCYQATAYYNASAEKHAGEFSLERLYLAQSCEPEHLP